MEQLVMSIAIPLAKQYGMNKALEIAYERLGIAPPQNTEIDILTGGGINQQAFSANNLANMLKRTGLRLGANTLMKGAGSAILPLAGIIGLTTFLNKNRKRLTGYDTQQAYEDARAARIANKRLDKITDRIIGGKDYGNYEEALLDSGAGAVKIDGTIYSGADYQGDGGAGDGAGDGAGGGGNGSKSRGSNRSDRPGGSASFGQSFHGARGGIASL